MVRPLNVVARAAVGSGTGNVLQVHTGAVAGANANPAGTAPPGLEFAPNAPVGVLLVRP